MTENRLSWIEFVNANPDEGDGDVQDLIDAYRSLRADHAALKAAVSQALDRVGNLRVICPELAEAVGPKEADDARIP